MKSALKFFQKSTFLSTVEFEKNIEKVKRFGRNFHNGLYVSLPGFFAYFCIQILGKNESKENFTHKTVNGVDSLLITLCMLGNYSYFCCPLMTFQK